MPLAAVVTAGILAVSGLVLAACGSQSISAASQGSSVRSTSGASSSSNSASLAIDPATGKPSTSFTFSFTAPDTSGRRGETMLGYTLGVLGPSQPGCLAARSAAAPAASAGREVSLTLAPAKLGGLWCQGDYTAKVTEVQTPVCTPDQMCPQFIRVVGTVARGSFRVLAP